MTNLVVLQNNQPVTTSLNVAETFGKEDRHVLRDLDNLKEGVQNWADLFQESTYIHSQNKQTYRMIYMNRDGFTLHHVVLILGYLMNITSLYMLFLRRINIQR